MNDKPAVTADDGLRSKAERDARARLARNGRNPENGNRGIAVGSDLHLCEMLLGELDAARAKLNADTALVRAPLGYANVYRRTVDCVEVGAIDLYSSIHDARAFSADRFEPGYLGVAAVTLIAEHRRTKP